MPPTTEDEQEHSDEYNPDDYLVAVTLRFRTVEAKNFFMAGLSDSWGENACALEWDTSLAPTDPVTLRNDSFELADTFLVDPFDMDEEEENRMSNHNVHNVSTDALATLGTIIDERAGRDAIHVAVEPCVAGELLRPGQHVKLLISGFAHAPATLEDCVGIVDPFLKTVVMPGERFWLLVYPRTITSLRHVWSHPAFEDKEPAAVQAEPDKTASEAWLREFCRTADCPDYDDLIAAAIGKNIMENEDDCGYPGYYCIRNDGECLHFGGRDAHGEIPDEFWDHVEIVTGVKGLQRAKHFSCSC